MDLWPFPGLIVFDINDSFLDSTRCCDDDVTISWTHLCCRILVRDCRDCTLGIPPCILDPNVGRGPAGGKAPC